MDIDGYDGSELAPIHENEEPIDNSLTANVNQMFDMTTVEANDNLNNMGNQIVDNSTERYVENMNNENENENNSNNEVVENMDNKTNEKTTDVKIDKKTLNTMTGIGIFLIIWIIIGIIAFIVSLFCFGFSGSTTEKIIGLLLAIFFGPFYFIYFFFNKNYCGKSNI